MNLNELTITQATDGLKKSQFSSEDLVKSCLTQIRKVDNRINAFITVCEKEALEEAKRIDNRVFKKGDIEKLLLRYPLLGIPFSMKDIYCTKGVRCTAASNVLKNYVPQYSSTVYQRLKQVGAILIGKTNCDAWGHGSSTENSDFCPTNNPWNLERVAGGSSGGSAASLSSDMSLFDIGEDTGGSIRLPASFCSIVGMKVTYGRVSRFGAIAYASSLDSVGPMAKTVEDTALILEQIAGEDSLDATSSPMPVSKYSNLIKRGVEGIRIGVPKEYFVKGVDQKVKNLILKGIKTLEKLGGNIFEVSLPSTPSAIATYYLIAPCETSSNLARYDGTRYGFARSKFSDEAKRRIMLGTYALSAGYYEAYYLKAMQVRSLIKRDFEDVFKKVDVLVTPASPTPPFKLEERISDPLTMYLSDIFTVTANLAGIPGLAVPAGFIDGLPVGMQILGPQFSEELLFQVGYAYEQATKWHQKRPNLDI